MLADPDATLKSTYHQTDSRSSLAGRRYTKASGRRPGDFLPGSAQGHMCFSLASPVNPPTSCTVEFFTPPIEAPSLYTSTRHDRTRDTTRLDPTEDRMESFPTNSTRLGGGVVSARRRVRGSKLTEGVTFIYPTNSPLEMYSLRSNSIL